MGFLIGGFLGFFGGVFVVCLFVLNKEREMPEIEKIAQYDRVTQWQHFSDQVERHIVEYTLVQYGNPEGNEQVNDFSVEDCFTNMARYMNRRNASVRGIKEQLRDVIKIAHYASFIYDKLKVRHGMADVYLPLGHYDPTDEGEI